MKNFDFLKQAAKENITIKFFYCECTYDVTFNVMDKTMLQTYFDKGYVDENQWVSTEGVVNSFKTVKEYLEYAFCLAYKKRT